LDREWTLADFEYELPEELIAQKPVEPRDHSRLMVVHRESDTIEHRRFYDLSSYLRPGDCVVLNNTRVLPARLRARRDPTGGRVEVLLLHPVGDREWTALVRPGRGARPGQHLFFEDGTSGATVVSMAETGERTLAFDADTDAYELMYRSGEVPLPPYVHRKLDDVERYQTVYSEREGSVAAPTAGLHFTDRMLRELRSMGVTIAYITLHVGVGTFRPVTTGRIAEHSMHSEYYTLEDATARTINRCRQCGGRIVAVGTTAARTLETCGDSTGEVTADSGWTDLYIRPGYAFGVVDVLLTNFHLPRTTLLMLVAAFTGYELMQRAYRIAIAERYRFYSLGDAMLII